MKFKNILLLFGDGFKLANKSLEVLLLSLIISIISVPGLFLTGEGMQNLITFWSMPFIFIHPAFILSVPLLLIKKQKNEKLTFKELTSILWRILKRTFLPMLLIFILLIVALIAGAIALFVSLNPSPEQFQNLFANRLAWSAFLSLLFMGAAFFEFTAFYFSLENEGLYKSFRSSFRSALKNLSYTSIVALVILIMSLPTLLLPENSNLAFIPITLINTYINFIVACTSLPYFQKVIKKT